MQISRQNGNRIQIDAVSLFTRQMKPHRFENAPLLAAVSNRHGFDNSLDRCRVNRRYNRIEIDAVTTETAASDSDEVLIISILSDSSIVIESINNILFPLTLYKIMGHSIFYPHPPYGRHFLKCQEGHCWNLDFLLQFWGSESEVFVLYKNGPVGIKLQSKRGLSESNFRGERDLSESDFRPKGTCRKNAFHKGGGGEGCG